MSRSQRSGPPNRSLNDLLTLVIIFGLLAAVYLLPPDTALAQVQQVGVLRVCVPNSYPPLVTGNPDAPGIDLEILQRVTADLGVRLMPVTNSNMGRDFNPRNWRVNRAQCQVLAGGVIASPTTRSFLETTKPYLETGWALVAKAPVESLEGRAVGFFAGVSGLDRIALSRYLREQGARAVITNSAAALAAAIESGEVDAGVTEALTARVLAGEHDWYAQWLPESLGRYPIAFGLWKGDLTLKRAIEAALHRLETSGELERIVAGYELVGIAEANGSN